MEVGDIEVRFPPMDWKLRLGLFLLVTKTYLKYSSFFGTTDLQDTLLSAGASVLFALVILESWYSYSTLIAYGVVLLLGFYSSMRVGNVTLFVTIITCLAIRREKFDNVIQFIYQCELAWFVIHMVVALLMALLGKYNLYILVTGVSRCRFGFNHPNVYSVYLINLILMWVWLHFDKIEWKNIYTIFGIATLSYLFAKTRTAYLITILFCGLIVLVRNNFINKDRLMIMAGLSVPMAAVFVYVFGRMFRGGGTLVKIVDELLSGRIRLMAYALENIGLTMFGKNLVGYEIHWDPYWKMNSFTFDSIYASFYCNLGIIWLILICTLFILLAKRGDMKINVFLIMWALYGVTETHGLYCYMCFPILMVVKLIQPKEDIEEKKEKEAEKIEELEHLRPYQRAANSRRRHENSRHSHERSGGGW